MYSIVRPAKTFVTTTTTLVLALSRWAVTSPRDACIYWSTAHDWKAGERSKLNLEHRLNPLDFKQPVISHYFLSAVSRYLVLGSFPISCLDRSWVSEHTMVACGFSSNNGYNADPCRWKERRNNGQCLIVHDTILRVNIKPSSMTGHVLNFTSLLTVS